MFSLIWAWINDCINNRTACDLRRRRVIVMYVTWYKLQACMVGYIDCSGVFLFCYFSSPWHDSMRLYCHFVNTKPCWYITTLTLCISKTLPNLWHLSNLRHVIHSSRNSISYLETASQTDMPRELNMTKYIFQIVFYLRYFLFNHKHDSDIFQFISKILYQKHEFRAFRDNYQRCPRLILLMNFSNVFHIQDILVPNYTKRKYRLNLEYEWNEWDGSERKWHNSTLNTM